jgi:formylglycine-generating enzyme required for sulfatase activity
MIFNPLEVKQNHIGMSFAYIPAGSFLMGSNETENSLRQDFPQYELTRLSEIHDESPWHTWPLYCRSSFRNVNTPESRYILAGMRLVLED